jgi:phage shock protein PspC (stress-responsive transcriptional regulator)
MNTATADTSFTATDATTTATDSTTTGRPAARQLRRSTDDAMLGGVASGAARYLNADVTLVRIITAALAIFTGAGVAVYIAAWLLIPADGDDQSIAQSWIASRRSRTR